MGLFGRMMQSIQQSRAGAAGNNAEGQPGNPEEEKEDSGVDLFQLLSDLGGGGARRARVPNSSLGSLLGSDDSGIMGQYLDQDDSYTKVYQFKVQLDEIKPPIWRRIVVPENYNFWDLHNAIQNAMGWMDCHLHAFKVKNPQTKEKEDIGIPDNWGMGVETQAGWKLRISDYFSLENKKAEYTYDFGDSWDHKITLEKILDRDKKQEYPQCTGGKRACPPEDCGSTPGYYELCETLKDPKNEEYEDKKEWLEMQALEDYDPNKFDKNAVAFEDPREALRNRIRFGGFN